MGTVGGWLLQRIARLFGCELVSARIFIILRCFVNPTPWGVRFGLGLEARSRL